MADLSKTALTANLTITMWSGKLSDLRVKNQVADDNEADPAAGTYIKQLMPEDEALLAVQRKEREIRNAVKADTLPWDDKGTRILAARNFLDFTKKMREHKSEWNKAVDVFAVGYPESKVKAKDKLGKMYDESEYPLAENVRQRFSLDLAIGSVPSNDLRVGIPDEHLQKLQSEMSGRIAQQTQDAMCNLWQDLYSYAKRTLNMRRAHLGLDRERLEKFKRMNFAEDEDFDAMIGRLRHWPKGKDAGDLLEDLRLQAEANGDA